MPFGASIRLNSSYNFIGEQMLRDSVRILIIDDTKFSCKFIRNALKKEGYVSINVANNAAEALSHLTEHSFDEQQQTGLCLKWRDLQCNFKNRRH